PAPGMSRALHERHEHRRLFWFAVTPFAENTRARATVSRAAITRAGRAIPSPLRTRAAAAERPRARAARRGRRAERCRPARSLARDGRRGPAGGPPRARPARR